MMQRTQRLIFAWPGKHDGHLLLPAALFCALILHIAALWIFRLVYPEGQTIGPETARVWVPTKSTPDLHRITAWIAADDPAVFTPIRPEESLAELSPVRPFVPSYMRDSLRLAFPDVARKAAALPPPDFPPLSQFGTSSRASESPRAAKPVVVIRPQHATGNQLVIPIEETLAARMPQSVSATFLVHPQKTDAPLSLFLISSTGSPEADAFLQNLVKHSPLRLPGAWNWLDVEITRFAADQLPAQSEPIEQ